MRILHVCTLRAEANGIYLVLKNLINVQRNLGNEVKVINICENGVINDDFQYYNFEGFRKFIKKYQPNIVIFHGIFYKQIISFSYYLRKKKIPYLIELHGAQSKENLKKSHYKKQIVNILFLNKVIKKSEGIIYLNEQEKNNSTVNNLNPIHYIIPNGCEPISNHALLKSKPFKEFLYLSRINRIHKGLDILIKAFKDVCDSGRKVHLSIYGRESNHEELEWLLNEINGYEGYIDFYGTVYGKEKESAFINSDFFILTSRYEGFPIAILEAWSYGLPCIVTPGTNVADLVDENDCGLICDPSVEKIKKTIIEACSLPENIIKDMVHNCIELSKKFSWDEIGKLSIQYYNNAIKKYRL